VTRALDLRPEDFWCPPAAGIGLDLRVEAVGVRGNVDTDLADLVGETVREPLPRGAAIGGLTAVARVRRRG
jgi:hypothetical protein